MEENGQRRLRGKLAWISNFEEATEDIRDTLSVPSMMWFAYGVRSKNYNLTDTTVQSLGRFIGT